MTARSPLPRVAVFYEDGSEVPVSLGELMWAPSHRACVFQWSEQAERMAVSGQLNLSPLGIRPGAHLEVAKTGPFNGLHELFADSIPDGFGLRAMNHGLRTIGIDPSEATPVERLAWVGERGIGALAYRPILDSSGPQPSDIHEAALLAARAEEGDFQAMPREVIRAAGSAQGARPKFWASLSVDGERVLLGDSPKVAPGYTPVLLKFAPSREDPSEPILEATCLALAKDHGLMAARGRLLKHRAGHCLAVERFDRGAGGARVHTLSVAALLNIDFRQANFDYVQLGRLAKKLGGQSQADRVFSQCCFNVALHLRDDHTKNFAFCMDSKGQWLLSPAYDLCPSAGVGYGGEHTMAIDGKGKDITRGDLLALADHLGVSSAYAGEALDQARAAAAAFAATARGLGAPTKTVRAWDQRIQAAGRLLAPTGLPGLQGPPVAKNLSASSSDIA